MRMARVAWQLAAAGVVALGAVAAGHHPARAFSGDVFPGTPPGEVPTYTISAASCESIREDVGDTGNLSDLIVACSRAGGGGPPCDLVDGSADSVVPIGQCVDKFPIPLATVNPALGLLNGINLKGTSSGSNVRFSDRDRVSVTFADTLARVDVEVGAGGGPAQCPQPNGGISVAAASEATCTRVGGLLAAAAGVSSAPTLSHLLLLDVEKAGQSGFLRVGVCPGFHWSCPSSDPLPTPTSYQGQMTFGVEYGSICSTVNRKTICCATYPAPRTGVPIPPCPK